MSLTDQEFREQHQPLHVPSSFEKAVNDVEKVTFVLADLGAGTADDVSRHLEEFEPGIDRKIIIAKVHQILTELYENGKISGREHDGGLVFDLHKITRPNDGAVEPGLLAPGLD